MARIENPHPACTITTPASSSAADLSGELPQPRPGVVRLVDWKLADGQSPTHPTEVPELSSPSEAEHDSLASQFSSEADFNSTIPLSVESCVQIATSSHPKIAAARARVVAAHNRVPQARALADPMLENMFWPITSNSLQTAGGRMQNQIGLSQQIPWPEKRQAKAAIACREVQIAQAEVESIEREIAEAVRLAYYELWFAERGTQILRENQTLVVDPQFSPQSGGRWQRHDKLFSRSNAAHLAREDTSRHSRSRCRAH